MNLYGQSSPENNPNTDYILSANPLKECFYLRNTVTVEKSLLGKGLFISRKRKVLLVEIAEVEAYLFDDPASHSFTGPTPRNWPMFETGGMCYVYLSYGINFCMNVVTGPKGKGEAVLLRAAAPLLGIEIMQKNRGLTFINSDRGIRNLLSGPGKITQALGIDLSFNGKQFDALDFKFIDLGRAYPDSQIWQTPRIGISRAKDLALRFCVKSSPWLSRRTGVLGTHTERNSKPHGHR